MPRISAKKTTKATIAKVSQSEEKKVISSKKLSTRKSVDNKEKKASEKIESTLSEPEIKKDITTKVLKADELSEGGEFLSGLGFPKIKKIEKPQKEEKHLQHLQEEEQESIVLEKPRRTFSFETVTITPPKIIGREDSSFIGKEKLPKSQKSLSSKHPGSKRGDQPHRAFNRPEFSKGKVYEVTSSSSIPSPSTISPPPTKVQKIATTSANLIRKSEIVIEDKITVKEFSEKMGVPLPEVMKKLIENKIMTSITASLDFDTAALIAAEFGILAKKPENKVDIQTFMSGDLQAILDLDKEAEVLLPRPPIVTVMGHVDHGKTSLLDYLRKTSIANGEAGGITQSIGASVVEYEGKKICFIDTPGHELFTSLRARGAKLTNIAVIVVAADDSVMPQTIESINHAKEAGVPIIVAITKIDKPGKNMDHIKQDLAKHGLTPEDRGGDTPVIGVSSKTGQGIPDLLETILLQAEILDLKYNPHRSAVGVILDAHMDPKQGVVSTIIVMTGTLKVGDIIVAYTTTGKIRRMQDWKGRNIQSATGGEPVQVLGITELPEPGRIVEVVKNEKEAQEKIELIKEQIKKTSGESAINKFLSQLQSGSGSAELKLILKADGSSSLEALKQAVTGVQLPKNVALKIIQANVGHFSDSDLALAQVSGALLLGFNVSINSLLKKKADALNIEMKNFDVIYELTDYLDNLLKGMVEVEKKEVMFAKLEVLGIFFTKHKEMIIGGRVIYGKLHGKPKFTVIRGENILCNGYVLSLHKNKDEVKEVGEGEECGLKVITGKKIEIGDIIEFYELQEVVDNN